LGLWGPFFDSHDGRAVLIVLRGCAAPVQEGPFLVLLVGVLSVCAWCCLSVYTAPISPVPVLTLKGDAWVTRVITWQL
jgi:hypothetical protein